MSKISGGFNRKEFLRKAFKELEDVRKSAANRGDIDSVITIDGSHIYSNGLFEPLAEKFSSSGAKVTSAQNAALNMIKGI